MIYGPPAKRKTGTIAKRKTFGCRFFLCDMFQPIKMEFQAEREREGDGITGKTSSVAAATDGHLRCVLT